ncbi:hypothetical protein HKX48_006838 [Thoreauomyces humboldtii]|nr:hypothetical protein HKX48_006838 [Thoreauomyces humboldtii]
MAPVHNLCSAVQNSFRWHLRRIAVPQSTTNRAICRILYEEGFISSISTGDEKGPYPATASTTRNPSVVSTTPTTTTSASSSSSSPIPSPTQPPLVPRPVPNPASQKIWLNLKYKDGQPVLRRMSVVSKPSRRVYASLDELKAVAAARRAGPLLKGQEVGQVTILDTPYGIIELKEALAKEVGGEVLCIAV